MKWKLVRLGLPEAKLNASRFTSSFFCEFENYVVVSSKLKGHLHFLVAEIV